MRSAPHPYGVAISGAHIYWTDWQMRAILRADHVTGMGVTTVIHNVTGLMDVHAVDRTLAFTGTDSDALDVLISSYCCVSQTVEPSEMLVDAFLLISCLRVSPQVVISISPLLCQCVSCGVLCSVY